MDQNRKRQPSPLRYSIRTRLILLFIISFLVIFSIAGCYLLWEIRATLDEALGKNLEAMAKVIAMEIDPNFLAYLQPGDEGSRTYQNILGVFERFQTVTDVSRIYLFGNDLRSIFNLIIERMDYLILINITLQRFKSEQFIGENSHRRQGEEPPAQKFKEQNKLEIYPCKSKINRAVLSP